jgi:hypothetical protein
VTRDHARSVEQSGLTRGTALPGARVLRVWSTRDWSDGLHVDALSALDHVIIRTENSTYEIVVLAPSTGDVLVRGGAYFPVLMPARLAGSSLGGSFLKLGSVHLGFRLELNTDRGSIITSPVRAIEIVPAVTNTTAIM